MSTKRSYTLKQTSIRCRCRFVFKYAWTFSRHQALVLIHQKPFILISLFKWLCMKSERNCKSQQRNNIRKRNERAHQDLLSKHSFKNRCIHNFLRFNDGSYKKIRKQDNPKINTCWRNTQSIILWPLALNALNEKLNFDKFLYQRNISLNGIIYLVRSQKFRETNISNSLIHTRTCKYQGVRLVSFLENLANALNEWSLVGYMCSSRTFNDFIISFIHCNNLHTILNTSNAS